MHNPSTTRRPKQHQFTYANSAPQPYQGVPILLPHPPAPGLSQTRLQGLEIFCAPEPETARSLKRKTPVKEIPQEASALKA